MYISVAQDYRSKPGEYGETKKQKQFLLTPSASDMLDVFVNEYSTTRSDLLEKIIRGMSSLSKEARDAILLQLNVIENKDAD